MVIQCESCRTVFNFDESLLKEEGTKVRCSRCRHVFTAYPSESATTDEMVGISDVFEEDKPTSVKKTDDVIAEVEKGGQKEKENGAGVGLEPDLDVIYQDVFSRASRASVTTSDLDVTDQDVFREVDRGDPDEEPGSDEALEEVFKEAGRGEKRLARRQTAIFPPMDTMEDETDKDYDPLKESPPERKSSKLSMAVVIPLILIVLGVGGAVVAWKADLIPSSLLSLLKPSAEKKEATDPGARLLQFGSVSGVFVNSEKRGPLFVIRGMVNNKYPENRRYILIKGSILNNKGDVVVAKTAYAGNTFSEEELKTLPLDEITKAADNRDGMARQNLDVAPGAMVPFMIVFAELPDDLSEFTVEAVSSSSGS